jgi:T-complex protein 1 subunit alpha
MIDVHLYVSLAMKTKIVGAKIACLEMNFQKLRMPLGVNIVVTDPEALEAIRQRESAITMERIRKILNAGANVILTTKGMDDASMKLFIDAGTMAVRRCQKDDLKRIAKATGASLISTLANLEGEETFEASMLGHAEQVSQVCVGDDSCIVLGGTKFAGVASILLRGANDTLLDEMERAMHDALCVIKRTLESNTVVAGGGALEAALSVYLEGFATTLGSREQLAIAKYAESLLVIPKTLAVNAAKDATDLVAKLRALHHAAQTQGLPCHLGLDLFRGQVRDNLKAGVIEPTLIKIKSLKAATEAAISILRIDDTIKLEKPKEQRPDRDQCE